jgi:Tfp pilus assembly protein PilF
VIEHDPNHYKAMCQLGILYIERHEFETAASYLKTCLKLNPKYITGMTAMGNLLFESGHSKTAAKYFE